MSCIPFLCITCIETKLSGARVRGESHPNWAKLLYILAAAVEKFSSTANVLERRDQGCQVR